jgi:NADH-quinone oxidoreductase subunit M
MLLLLTLLLPLAGALFTLLLGKNNARYVSLVFSLAALGTGLALLPLVNTDAMPLFDLPWIANPNIHFSVAADGLSYLMVLLTIALVPVIIISTYGRQIENTRSFYSLILFMEFALVGVFIATDGFLYYIFWELALIPIYFIALLWGDGERQERSKVVLKFFIYTLAGSLFMLLGFIYLYQFTGSFKLEDLYALNLSPDIQKVLFWAFFLAFAIKIPIVPFHTWQAETYKEAPTAGSMLLSGIMLKMGLYSLLRWLLPVLPAGTVACTPFVIALCVIGVVYGSVIAIRQDNIKRLIAYSSLAHVGLIAAGIFTLSQAGFQGAIVQMLAHGVNVIALFFCGEIIYRRAGTYDINKLGGIRAQAPRFASFFMITVFASVALPLTNGFIGEFLLLFSIYEYNTLLSIAAGLTIILGAVYALRMFQRTMLGTETETTAGFKEITTGEMVAFVPLIAAIIVFGVYPKPIMDIAQPAVNTILEAIAR